MKSLAIILPLLVILLGTFAEGQLCKKYTSPLLPWGFPVKNTKDLWKFNIKCPNGRVINALNLKRLKGRRSGRCFGKRCYRYTYECCKFPSAGLDCFDTATTAMPPFGTSLTPLFSQDVACISPLTVLNKVQMKWNPTDSTIHYRVCCSLTNRPFSSPCEEKETLPTPNNIKNLIQQKPICSNDIDNKQRYMQRFQLYGDDIEVYYKYTCCGFPQNS